MKVDILEKYLNNCIIARTEDINYTKSKNAENGEMVTYYEGMINGYKDILNCIKGEN